MVNLSLSHTSSLNQEERAHAQEVPRAVRNLLIIEAKWSISIKFDLLKCVPMCIPIDRSWVFGNGPARSLQKKDHRYQIATVYYDSRLTLFLESTRKKLILLSRGSDSEHMRDSPSPGERQSSNGSEYICKCRISFRTTLSDRAACHGLSLSGVSKSRLNIALFISQAAVHGITDLGHR
jgi:hypothetical protein